MVAFLMAAGAVALGFDESFGVDAWTTRDGLPQNSVTDILQDRGGYIWVTTFGGIARFDGRRFLVFDPATTPELPSTRFVAVAEGHDGTLWFGTEAEGLVRFDGERFEGVGGPSRVNALHVDRLGDLWVGAPDGAHRWSGDERHRELDVPAEGFMERADGSLWTSTPDGLRCLRDPCDAPWRGMIGAPPVDTPDGAYLAGWDGYLRVRGGEVETLVSTSTAVRPVVWNGGVWGHADGRLVQLDGTGELELDGTGRVLRVDREGGLWVGRNGGGLARVRSRGLRRVSPHSMGLALRPDGAIVSWVCPGGTVDGGALPAVLDRFCGRGRWVDGVLWVGGAIEGFQGLARIVDDRAEPAVRASSTQVLDGWAVADGVLYALEPGGARRVEVEGLTPGFRGVRASDGDAWLASSERVVRVAPSGRATWYRSPPASMPVRDVLPGVGGAWVSTYGGGLHWIQPDAPSRGLTIAEGLCDNAVSRMLLPGDGYLWINTNHGAGRVALAELDAWRAGERAVVLCELVDSGEANGPDGLWTGSELVLPTIHGAVAVDPESALKEPVAPKVHIESARCGDRPVADGGERRGACALTVEYTALSFDDPNGLRFRTRVAGLSETWSPLSDQRRLALYDVPPGEYVVEVQARSSRGVWSDVARLAFRRAPEWWETRVGRALPPLGVVSIVLLGLLLRIRTATRQNEELRSQVEQRVRAESILRAEQEEKHRVLEELEASRRLEAIGRLAGGVAHDFNNLLMVIQGRLESLRGSADRAVREDVGVVLDAAERAAGLTAQLLAFGRRGAPQPEILDLSAFVKALLPVLDRLVAPTRVTCVLGEDVRVRMDRSRLQQLVTNLAVNARDAGATEVVVRTRRDGDVAALEVEDDGEGMTPDVLARVFEPYFTTKGPGRGTGLGMATVHGVVEEAGGQIAVESEVGRGTWVRIRLRRTEGPAPERSSEPAATRLDGVRVLLVDDDDAVRATVGGQLELLGAEVVAVASGWEALAWLETSRPDVLLSDVLMPGLSGPELLDRIRERGLDVPVLFISGHTGESLGLTATVLRKPFTGASLAVAVAGELTRR
ncbi:MAG: response regulator [Alphaproteobacteria bacterium]|nr:response regulator [Alphaproteobacteria bacterium]